MDDIKEALGTIGIAGAVWFLVWLACSICAAWWALRDHMDAERERQAIARWIANRRTRQ